MISPKRVSAVMCTFNGRRFLQDQLTSILRQTRQVDEIIISDDCSTDDSLALAKEILRGKSLLHKELTGQERLGVTQNFARALSEATGDIIFLSDQDDVWLPHKVERVYGIFQQYPDIDLVFTNAHLVDSQLKTLGKSQFDMTRLNKRRLAALCGPKSFAHLLRYNVVTGATVAIHRRLLDYALPFSDVWLHDEWLAILAAARGGLRGIDESLVLYRQHDQNQCGMRPEQFVPVVKELSRMPTSDIAIKRLQAVRERVMQTKIGNHDEVQRTIVNAIHFEDRRFSLPVNRLLRSVYVIVLLSQGAYHKYSKGFRSAVKDMLISSIRI